jgi:hypothetical protein
MQHYAIHDAFFDILVHNAFGCFTMFCKTVVYKKSMVPGCGSIMAYKLANRKIHTKPSVFLTCFFTNISWSICSKLAILYQVHYKRTLDGQTYYATSAANSVTFMG